MHRFGRFALGKAISGGDRGVGYQPMAVAGEGVAHVAQLAGVAAFAIQLRTASVFDTCASLLRLVSLKLVDWYEVLQLARSESAKVSGPRMGSVNGCQFNF